MNHLRNVILKWPTKHRYFYDSIHILMVLYSLVTRTLERGFGLILIISYTPRKRKTSKFMKKRRKFSLSYKLSVTYKIITSSIKGPNSNGYFNFTIIRWIWWHFCYWLPKLWSYEIINFFSFFTRTLHFFFFLNFFNLKNEAFSSRFLLWFLLISMVEHRS